MKKGECSAPLWSFNFVSKGRPAANCVRFCLNPFCREVYEGCLLHNKTILIKPYSICRSHQLGLEVERSGWSTISFFVKIFCYCFGLLFWPPYTEIAASYPCKFLPMLSLFIINGKALFSNKERTA